MGNRVLYRHVHNTGNHHQPIRRRKTYHYARLPKHAMCRCWPSPTVAINDLVRQIVQEAHAAGLQYRKNETVRKWLGPRVNRWPN